MMLACHDAMPIFRYIIDYAEFSFHYASWLPATPQYLHTSSMPLIRSSAFAIFIVLPIRRQDADIDV